MYHLFVTLCLFAALTNWNCLLNCFSKQSMDNIRRRILGDQAWLTALI